MGRNVYTKPFSFAEFNFQAVNTHTVATNNVAFFTGDNDIEIMLKGDAFRKTTTAGGDSSILLELFELNVAPTGGTEYVKYFGVNKDREGKALQEYISVKENVVYVVNPSGIMLRERSIASKDSVDRSGDLCLEYSLKKNTWYVVVSSVVAGANLVESLLYGELRILREV
jgi:hypothetical protein